jgi:hypothetical protein
MRETTYGEKESTMSECMSASLALWVPRYDEIQLQLHDYGSRYVLAFMRRGRVWAIVHGPARLIDHMDGGVLRWVDDMCYRRSLVFRSFRLDSQGKLL